MVDDLISAIGTGEAPSADEIVDLPGATILPGFIDAHVHLAGTGMSAGTPALRSARSARELMDAAASLAAAGSRTTMAHGWDESRWPDPALPSLTELGSVSDRPMVLVRIDGHMSLANLAAISASRAESADGVDRDAEGRPTGVVRGAANRALQRWVHAALDEAHVRELHRRGAAIAASVGVTTVHEMSMISERGLMDVQVLMSLSEELPIRAVPYVATTDLGIVRDLGLPRIGGDLPFDGSIGARTAWVSGGYLDAPGPASGSVSDDDLFSFFRDGNAAGLQVGVHAIGDAAIDAVVATWERVAADLTPEGLTALIGRRHRIEHVEMPSADLIRRMARLGLACSVQPSFDAQWGGPDGMYARALGAESAAGMNPFRSMLEAGLEVGFGSDSPITALDPLAGVVAAQLHTDPSQRLSRSVSMGLSTGGSARLAHLEGVTGALSPGLEADLVAYDGDPYVHDLKGLRPILVLSRGRVVHQA